MRRVKVNWQIIFLVLFIGVNNIRATAQRKTIVLEAIVPDRFNGDSTVLYTANIFSADFDNLESKHKVKVAENIAKFVIYADTIMAIQNLPLRNYEYMPYLAAPGDHIKVVYQKDSVLFNGEGAEKFNLVYQLNLARKKVLPPINDKYSVTKSLDDFFSYSQYIKGILNLQLRILDLFRSKVPSVVYLYLKGSCIDQSRLLLTQKFSNLLSRRADLGLLTTDLKHIYDSTFALLRKTEEEDDDEFGSGCDLGLRLMINLELLASRSFSPYESDLARHTEQYYYIKRNLRGVARERVLTGLLTFSMLRKSVDSASLALVRDYLSSPGYSEYKGYVQRYLDRALAVSRGKEAIDFTLTNATGGKVSLKDLKGRVVVLDFWFTGCKGCVEMVQHLKNVEDTFHANSNVVFLSICTDKERAQWIKSVDRKKYTTGSAVSLYTEGQGTDHPIISSYNVTAYPQLFVIDSYGKFAGAIPDPRRDQGRGLIDLISRTLISREDGPYVFYRNGGIEARKVELVDGRLEGRSADLGTTGNAVVSVNTDVPDKTFKVSLRKRIQSPPSTYSKPDKILALSDIEGNFNVLRKLLQSNGVIDENFNWIFGAGHLVFCGDMFDRGEQVTECLWLIYSLEEKAEAAGGCVHYIMGNHEIMNLSGDTRYVQPKYIDSVTTVLDMRYSDLFGKESELGRWLATKNVMEKIGDILFVHGGVSKEVNNLRLSIEEINALGRPYYRKMDSAVMSNNRDLKVLYDAQKPASSPFWNRTYYDNEGDPKKADMNQVDHTLEKFSVRRIVTGHTIVKSGDKVTAHYNNKIINIDTEHAVEKSEALLVKEGKYYRVNIEGKSFLLFD